MFAHEPPPAGEAGEAAAAVGDVFQNMHLCAAILDFLAGPGFAAVPAVSRAFRTAAGTPTLDAAFRRMALQRWPISASLPGAMGAGLGAGRGFCRRRVGTEETQL